MTSSNSAEPHANPRSRALAVAIIVVACVAVYGRALGFDFVAYDDQIHVYANPFLNPPTWANVAHFWTAPYEKLYVPLSYTLFAALCVIARKPADASFPSVPSLNPAIFHGANLILHIASSLLVFALIRRIVKVDLAALAGSLVFALHPVQVESVAWISELRGLLASALGLAAVALYTRSVPKAGSTYLTRAYFAAIGLFALSVLAKPSAVVIPAVALLVDMLSNRRSAMEYAAQLGPWFAIAVAFIAVTHSAQPVRDALNVPLAARPLVAGDALAFYIGKLILPWPLSIDYGHDPRTVLANGLTKFVWLVPVAVAIGVWAVRKRWPWLPITVGISLAALAPMLGLVPFTYQYISTVADRYAYLALIGPAIALAIVVAKEGKRAAIPTAVVVAVYAALSGIHLGAWRNTFTLMTSTLAVNPASAGAHLDLGALYADRSEFDRAEVEFATAVKLRPDYSEAHYNLGNMLKERGAYQQAIDEYHKAIEIDPQRGVLYMNLANVVLDTGHPKEALEIFDVAEELDPRLPKVDYNRGNALMQLGRNDEALASFQKEIAKNPNFASSYINAGIILVSLHRLTEAEAVMTQGVQVGKPTAARYANLAYVNAQLGHVSDAARNLATAQQIDPNDESVKAIVAALKSGGRK